MLKRQEVTLIITYDDSVLSNPSDWVWDEVLDGGEADVLLKGYSEPVEANL